MEIVNYLKDMHLRVPLYGGAADITKNAMIKKGATYGTDNCFGIRCASRATYI